MTQLKFISTAVLVAAGLIFSGVIAVGEARPDSPGPRRRRGAADKGPPVARDVTRIDPTPSGNDRGPGPSRGSRGPARCGSGRADRLPRRQSGRQVGSEVKRVGRPVHPAGATSASRPQLPPGTGQPRRHVPLDRRVGARVRARLGLGRPQARHIERADGPAGGGRAADRGADRRPGGPARRRRPSQGRAPLVRQGRADSSDWLVRAGTGRPTVPGRASTVADRRKSRSPPPPAPTAASAWRASAATGSPSILVSGPTIATAELYVQTRDGPAVPASGTSRPIAMHSNGPSTARRFEYAAAPTRPIEGIIRDKDTGRPLAGYQAPGHGLRGAQPDPGPRASRRRPTPGATIASPACPGAGLSPVPSSRARASPTPRPPSGRRPARPAGAGPASTSR